MFHPDSRLIVVPVIDEAFTADHFDSVPDEIRTLARQELVVMDAARPDQAIQSIQASIGTLERRALRTLGAILTPSSIKRRATSMHAGRCEHRDAVRTCG